MKTGLESIVESLEAKMHEGTIIKGTRIEKLQNLVMVIRLLLVTERNRNGRGRSGNTT